MDESEGIAGFHLNGDVSPWYEGELPAVRDELQALLSTIPPPDKLEGPWLLRKQAEAIEAMIENLPWYQNRVFMKLNDAEDYAHRLRNQADELEQAND